MRHYHINIFYSDDDEGYIADIPDLEACSAFGDTPDEDSGIDFLYFSPYNWPVYEVPI